MDQLSSPWANLWGNGAYLMPPGHPLDSSPLQIYVTIHIRSVPGMASSAFLGPETTWFSCANLGLDQENISSALFALENPLCCDLAHIIPQVFIYNGEGDSARVSLGLGLSCVL